MQILPDTITENETIHCFVSDLPPAEGGVCICVRAGQRKLAPDVALSDRDALTDDLWKLVRSGAYTARMAHVGFGIVLEKKEAESGSKSDTGTAEAAEAIADRAGQ